MGRFHVSDSFTGVASFKAVRSSNPAGYSVKRDVFRLSEPAVLLPAVLEFTPLTDFVPPLAVMSENFRPYFCGRKFTRESEVKIRPYVTNTIVKNKDLHETVKSGGYRLLHTGHLFALLKMNLGLGTVVLSRRQSNLLYMMGTNQTGHLVTVTFVNGMWALDAKEPTSQDEWPAGTKIFFLD